MARILVLGGAGFIGYHLVRHIAEKNGGSIVLVDNLSRGQLDDDLEQLLAAHPQIELHTGDLTRSDTFEQIGGSFDSVYLLAGIVGVRNVQADPAKVIHTNTSIILNTLEWLRRVGCRRLLFASTSEVYAGSVELGLSPVPTGETVPIGVVDVQTPRSTYAITKLLGEAAVTHYARSYGFEAVIVRYHNVYGPRMGFDHVIPEVMDRLLQRIDPLPVYGLDQSRAFCYVTDAVEASEALMTCPMDGCELVHVGNDQEIRIEALVDRMLEVTGLHPAIQPLPAPQGAVSRRCPDISKLRHLTDFEPSVSLDNGLALTWEWYRQNHRVRESAGGQPVESPSRLRQ